VAFTVLQDKLLKSSTFWFQNVATEFVEVNMGRKSRKKKERRAKVKKQNSHTKNAIKAQPINEAIPKEIVQKSSVGEQFQRIYNIFGVSDEDDAEVNMENLQKYLEYLKDNIETPYIVTGIEDMGCFGWEEYYTFGPGSERKYNKLKKKYPSFTDEYRLLGFHDDFGEEEGLYVDVQRISDKKKFSLTLADLEGVDKNSKNAQLIHDHSVWFVNFK
jgi:hypothetical protein